MVYVFVTILILSYGFILLGFRLEGEGCGERRGFVGGLGGLVWFRVGISFLGRREIFI